MIEKMFVEIGAVVTEVRGPTRCTIEPFCNLAQPPTYALQNRVEVNFEYTLDNVLANRGTLSVAEAAPRALYDLPPDGRAVIGPSWPGGNPEGVLSVAEDYVSELPTLAAAVDSLPGQRWEYQVLVTIDEVTGEVRRYHGFHAEVVREENGVLVLQVARSGTSTTTGWQSAATTVPYDPSQTASFYSGARVADLIVRGGANPRSSGAVFMTVEVAEDTGGGLPKLPHSAGDARPTKEEAGDRPAPISFDRETGRRSQRQRRSDVSMAQGDGLAPHTVTALTPDPADLFQAEIAKIMESEQILPPVTGATDEIIQAQRRRLVQELFEGADQVDLVGHSTPIHHYLRLGDWVLSRPEAERLASYLPASVKSVRLIGCATASTENGRAAVQALAAGGRSASGTRHNVYVTHFDKQGVKRGLGAPPLQSFRSSMSRLGTESTASLGADAAPQNVQTYAPDLTEAHQPSTASRALRPLGWLGRGAWWVIAAPLAALCWVYWLSGRVRARPRVPHRWIWWLLSSRGAPRRGLLTEPLLTYELTVGKRKWYLEILFDFELARFYSDAHSPARRARVYRIRGSRRVAKALLETYLETAPAGVKLIDHHEEAIDRCGGLIEGAARSERQSNMN